MRDDAVLRRALPLGRGLGPKKFKIQIREFFPKRLIRIILYARIKYGEK